MISVITIITFIMFITIAIIVTVIVVTNSKIIALALTCRLQSQSSNDTYRFVYHNCGMLMLSSLG